MLPWQLFRRQPQHSQSKSAWIMGSAEMLASVLESTATSVEVSYTKLAEAMVLAKD